jgi:hypothetical protein
MADPEGRARSTVTPRQLVLMGVLGAVLVVVLIGQFGGASSSPESAGVGQSPEGAAPRTDRAADQKPKAASAARSPDAAAAKPASRAWPKLSAEVAAQYDHFAVPEPLARQLIEGRRSAGDRKPSDSLQKRGAGAESVAALKSKGTNVIVRSERGAAAMLGNRVVRVGDVVEGYRVMSIDLQGIVLAPADRQESHEEHK